jgi:hypothetical protein
MELSSLRGMNTVENVSSELRWVGAVLGAEHQPQVAARYIHMSAIYFSLANPQQLETYEVTIFLLFCFIVPILTQLHIQANFNSF